MPVDGTRPDGIAEAGTRTLLFVMSAHAATVDSLADLFSTIADGVLSRLLVVVAMSVVDAPPVSGISWKGGPVTADGAGLPASPLPLGAALPPVAALGAELAAGAPLASDPLAPAELEAPDARSAHDPCSRIAGMPSVAPVEPMPIWTCVVPSG